MTLRLATSDDRPEPVRELSAFCAENIEAFAETDEPVSIALVVIGKTNAGAISWSLADKSILEVCSAAALLLEDRALSSTR